MKQTLLLTALSASLLFSNDTNAQIPGAGVVSKVIPKVTVGLKLGANFQSLDGTTWDNAYKAGFVGGAFVGITKKKIGVQVEGMLKSAKFDTKASTSSPSVSINTLYMDIPVLFEYKLVNRLWIQAGPQFSSLISAKQGSTDIKKNFNTSDFSGVVGLQAILPIHLVAGLRYVMGFSDMNNKSVSGYTDAWKNRSIQVYVGYRFL